MKLALISDVHANLEALDAVFRDLDGLGIDRIVCLGDLVGYNANPEECIARLQAADALCVAGNHDRAVAGQLSTEDFSDTAARGVTWTRKRLSAPALQFLAALPSEVELPGGIIAVHGALHPETGKESVRLDTDERRLLSLRALAARPSGARICAFGHTHIVGIYQLAGDTVEAWTEAHATLRDDVYYLLNPGAVGQPRSSDRRASYMIFETRARVVTLRRVEYDLTTAREKARKAGLLPQTEPRAGFLPAPLREGLKRAARELGVYDALKRRLG